MPPLNTREGDVVTKTRKGLLSFIKFALPKPKRPTDKPHEKPDKSKPGDRFTTLAVGEEGGRSDH
jgi:hypothetical protein